MTLSTFMRALLLILLCAVSARAETEFRRIVSLAPSCTEILADLALKDRLVGITSFTDYPPDVLHLPVIGSYVDPNIEAIVSLRPDLVVATNDGNPAHVLLRLQTLGIAVHVMNLQTYEDIQRSILKLASETQRQRQGRALVDRMKSVAACIRRKTEKQPKPSVLFIYDRYPFVTPGKGTFTDQMIRMSGGRSVSSDAPVQYPRLTIETVLAKNPDVVVETSMDPGQESEKQLAWWRQYPMLRAVQNNRVYMLPSRNLDRPSHRIVGGFLQLAAALHPNIFSPEDCR